jgi:hypothetical protein
LAEIIAQAGGDPTLEDRARWDALLAAIEDHGGYRSCEVDLACWIVFVHSRDHETFCGHTLEQALAGCMVYGTAENAEERDTLVSKLTGEPFTQRW